MVIQINLKAPRSIAEDLTVATVSLYMALEHAITRLQAVLTNPDLQTVSTLLKPNHAATTLLEAGGVIGLDLTESPEFVIDVWPDLRCRVADQEGDVILFEDIETVVRKVTVLAEALPKGISENLVDKVVTFDYIGVGNTLSGLRLVYVEKIEVKVGDDIYLEGQDIKETLNQEKSSYRRYKCERIRGRVKVLANLADIV